MAAQGDRLPSESFLQCSAACLGRAELRPVVDDVLLSGELIRSGFLRRTAVENLVAEERAGREDRSKQIWQLLTLELWLKNAGSLGVAS